MISPSTSINSFSKNINLEDTFNSVKVTIQTKKRWLLFLFSLFELIIIGLFGGTIVVLAAGQELQKYLPDALSYLVWVLMIGIWLFIIYKKFRETIEYVFDKEVIEFDNQSRW